MPSFDVVSELEWAEVTNALNQAQKELSQRFDFKGQDAVVERTEQGVVVRANSDDRTKAAWEVLKEKLVRRKVSLKHFDPGKLERGPKDSARITVKVKEGIDKDAAKEITKLMKESKLKVQASIQEQTVRITGKKKDDLQSAIQLLREKDFGVELQFKNFRD